MYCIRPGIHIFRPACSGLDQRRQGGIVYFAAQSDTLSRSKRAQEKRLHELYRRHDAEKDADVFLILIRGLEFSCHREMLSRSRMTTAICARFAASATRLKSSRNGAVAVGPLLWKVC